MQNLQELLVKNRRQQEQFQETERVQAQQQAEISQQREQLQQAVRRSPPGSRPA